ncbi:GPI mannosyltransferase 1 [Entomophthora muscae]|uniref:GPI mannosyltransferase 1 n=2 Tax=Entomophthora muscae TaxID=34485 RepID=A0ACC2TPQ4_9FUNG|nr:GPI mannosyltransferase 1 [Entomophthora muscae]
MFQQASLTSFTKIFIAGALLRIALLIYSEYQDANYEVKYTDIDYEVFTDASRYVAQGKSPYLRSTYRYTPLLAILLTPNIFLHKSFGKFLFVLADLFAGLIMKRLCNLRKVDPLLSDKIIGASWLLNPFVANISTRGNAESLLVVVILSSFYALITNRFTLGCILYGLSVHLKIYPIIYAVPLVFFIDSNYPRQRNLLKRLGKRPLKRQKEDSEQTTSHIVLSVLYIPFFWCKMFLDNILPDNFFEFFTRSRIQLALYSGGTFMALNCAMYLLYGQEFLEHTYLYHITRRDHRHNFSVWFYPIYLTATSDFISAEKLGLATFLPQFALTGLFGWAYGKDFIFACFLQTVSFVALNKVCTSQYFMWYLGLLPLVLTSTTLNFKRDGIIMLVLWVLGQGIWLAPAYFLEFKGHDTFILLWLASVIFLAINFYLLSQFIRHHRFQPIFFQGRIMEC